MPADGANKGPAVVPIGVSSGIGATLASPTVVESENVGIGASPIFKVLEAEVRVLLLGTATEPEGTSPPDDNVETSVVCVSSGVERLLSVRLEAGPRGAVVTPLRSLVGDTSIVSSPEPIEGALAIEIDVLAARDVSATAEDDVVVVSGKL